MALARRAAKARPQYGSLEDEGPVCNIIGYVTQLPGEDLHLTEDQRLTQVHGAH
jgi:hypothetical protein